jgi:hypothetical protein
VRIHSERTARLLSAIRAVATPDVRRVTANAVADRSAETSAGAYSYLHARRCYATLRWAGVHECPLTAARRCRLGSDCCSRPVLGEDLGERDPIRRCNTALTSTARRRDIERRPSKDPRLAQRDANGSMATCRPSRPRARS